MKVRKAENKAISLAGDGKYDSPGKIQSFERSLLLYSQAGQLSTAVMLCNL